MSVRNTFPQQRPTLNLDFANSKTLDPRITFTRTSTATYVDEDGLIKSVDADVARFDHDPVTGECLGLLVEEQRSNLLTYSDQLDEQSNWVDSGTSWSANTIISPDGTQNADDPGFVSEKWGFYDVTNASWISEYPQNYPFTVTSEWVRHSATITTPSECTTLRFYPLRSGNDISYIFQNVGVSTSTTYTASAYYKLADDGTTVIAWGAQLEAGAFPTSYIPRPDASTATRNPDVVTMTGDNFSDWYNQNEGSLIFHGNNQADASIAGNVNGFVCINDGTSNTRIDFRQRIVNSILSSNGTSVNWSNISTPSNITDITDSSFQKVGMAYSSNNHAQAQNGYLTRTSTASLDPLIATRLILFMRDSQTFPTNGVGGHIKQLTYYPTRLTNAQLQNLTK